MVMPHWLMGLGLDMKLSQPNMDQLIQVNTFYCNQLTFQGS